MTLKIYNILGQEVVTLVNGIEDPGERSVLWNAQAVSSGVYFYRLHVTAADGSVYLDSRKMVLLK